MEGERRKGRAEWRRASTVHRYTCKCGKQITKIPLSAQRTQLRRASRRSRSPVYPAVLICAPSDRILVSKSDLCCASNPRFNSSLDQDTTERAEWCDGEPRDAVKIPGNQSPRFRSSPSNVGEMSVLSCTDRRGKGGKKVFPAFGCSVD